MAIDLTPLLRTRFIRQAESTDRWKDHSDSIQNDALRSLLRRAASTETGKRFGFAEMGKLRNPYEAWKRRVPAVRYEDIREDVMRMINGGKDILWPGKCMDYAQSSGTSGGKSKYIPITRASLYGNHYPGASYSLAHYLRQVPESRIFSGKGFILGGSFASELKPTDPSVRVGDLSATLINRINPLVNLVRIPSKEIALMPDWTMKLPALVKAAADENVTNLSGVPSWFITVIKNILALKGADKISDVWPNLEVFFHGGISFEPYRKEYQRITDPKKMHFLETYNASEGFFACQDDLADPAMLLVIDKDVFYEFIPLDGGMPVPLWELEKGMVYEMVITSSNGLWRYRIGDTVRVESTAPVRIRISGRTKSFINAFGEELMEDNAERAMAEACRRTGAAIRNYSAAPLFASKEKKGRHEWMIEWQKKPADVDEFADILDAELRALNSDYDAKRTGSIFLDGPAIISAREGLFDRWLASTGTHKLGGQRKVPRLSNNRNLIEQLIELNKH